MLRVEQVTNVERLAELRGPWNGLAGGVPFQYWQWLHLWWNCYGVAAAGEPERQLAVVAVFEQDQLIGAAPLFLERSAARGRVLRLLGSGEVCTDYLSVLSRPGDLPRVVDAVAEYLSASALEKDEGGLCWDAIELENVLADDLAWQRLIEALEARGHMVARAEGYDCWRLQLPESWEAYEAMLSKGHRKQIRRAQRGLLETGRATLHSVRDARQLERGWEILVDLHQRRRQSLNEPGCFASARFTEFHRQVMHEFLSLGRLRLHWIELDGRPIAAEYQLAGDEVVFAYQAGIEPEALDDEPGNLSTIAILRQYQAEGVRAVDFLRGNEPYKARWRAEPQTAVDVRIVSPRAAARIRNGVYEAGNRAREWIKRGLELTGIR